VERVLIGSSRRGVLHHVIKGSFQRRIESLLPPDIHVQVLSIAEPTADISDTPPPTTTPPPSSTHESPGPATEPLTVAPGDE